VSAAEVPAAVRADEVPAAVSALRAWSAALSAPMVNGGGGAPGNTTPAWRPRLWNAQGRRRRLVHGCGTGAGGLGGINRRPRAAGNWGRAAVRQNRGGYTGAAMTICGHGG